MSLDIDRDVYFYEAQKPIENLTKLGLTIPDTLYKQGLETVKSKQLKNIEFEKYVSETHSKTIEQFKSLINGEVGTINQNINQDNLMAAKIENLQQKVDDLTSMMRELMSEVRKSGKSCKA